MKITSGLKVRIDYELKIKGGAVIETSAKSGPVEYVHGQGKMLPALEARLEGLSPGDERQGEIPAREAFGTEESLPTKRMAAKDFPAGTKPAPGLVFEAKGPQGAPVAFKVVAVQGDHVEVRLLHPLAGKDIAFRVKVLSVDDPSRPPPPPGVVELDLEEIE